MSVSVLNTTAGLSGKTLAILETAQTFTATQTFSAASGITLSNASGVLTFSGATAPKILFSAANAILSSNASVVVQLDEDNNGGESFIIKNGAGVATLTLGETGFTTWVGADSVIVLPEVTNPGAASANTLRLYCQDNGAGKTRLVVQFPSGGEQVLATEP